MSLHDLSGLEAIREMAMNRRNLLLVAAGVAGAAIMPRFFPKAKSTDTAFEINRSEAEWRSRLTPAQFEVLRKHGTEPAGSSPLDNEHRKGIFSCAGCDLPLFHSESKFDSGTGWPSFTAPIDGAVGTSTDRTLLLFVRTEVHCRRCGGHLGHVFEDGPEPTGLRYCMNGVALKFSAA